MDEDVGCLFDGWPMVDNQFLVTHSRTFCLCYRLRIAAKMASANGRARVPKRLHQVSTRALPFLIS